jgi:hypothetical protein
MADADTRLPVRALATDVTVEVANSTGTTINPAEEFAQGSTTSGQNGPLIQGAVTTAAPTYTTGQTSPLSLDPNGNLRVVTTSGAEQNVNVNEYGGVATTLGQKVSASSIPVVLASDQSPVPVTINENATQELPQYNTAAAVAANASSTQSYTPGSTVNLDGVDVSSSGQAKWEIQYGITGSETTKAVMFTSKGDLTQHWRLPNPVQILTTMTVKIIRTNMDNQPLDLYSTILVH